MYLKLFCFILFQFLSSVFTLILALDKNNFNLLSQLPLAMGSNGTLIDSSWVLTSTSYNPKSIIIGGIKRDIDRRITHPQWIEGKTTYDLQLLHLSEPITKFQPIKVLRENVNFGKDEPVILLGAKFDMELLNREEIKSNSNLLNLDFFRQAYHYIVPAECTFLTGLFYKKILDLNEPEKTDIRYFEPNDQYDSGSGIFVENPRKTIDMIDHYYLMGMSANVASDWAGSYAIGINPIFKLDINAWIDQEICKEALGMTPPIAKIVQFISSSQEPVEKITIIDQPAFADFIPADYENFVQGMLQNYMSTLIDPHWLLTLSTVDLPKEVRINRKNYKIDFKISYPKELDQFRRMLTLAHLENPVAPLSSVQRKRLKKNYIMNDSLIYISSHCDRSKEEKMSEEDIKNVDDWRKIKFEKESNEIKLQERIGFLTKLVKDRMSEDKETVKGWSTLELNKIELQTIIESLMKLAEKEIENIENNMKILDRIEDKKVLSMIQFNNQEIDKPLIDSDLECASGSGFYGPLPKKKTVDLLSNLSQHLKGIRSWYDNSLNWAYENIFNDPLAKSKELPSSKNKTYAVKVSLYALGAKNKTTYHEGEKYCGSNIFWLTKDFNSWIDKQILLYSLKNTKSN